MFRIVLGLSEQRKKIKNLLAKKKEVDGDIDIQKIFETTMMV